MFSLLTRRVVGAAGRAPSRENSGYFVYQRTVVSRTFFSAPVLADPAAKAATKKSSSEDATAKKRGRPAKAAPKPKAKKTALPAKPKFKLSMMPPTRPSPPYIIFSNEYLASQSELKASMSKDDLSHEDRKALLSARGKAAGVAWNELPEFEKEKYKAEYVKRREQYKTELAAWQETVDPETVKIINDHRRKSKRSRIVVPKQGPKRPLSSYLLFAQEKRDEVKNALSGTTSVAEIQKEVGRRWRSLSDEEKQPYSAKAAEANAAYHKAKAEYAASSA